MRILHRYIAASFLTSFIMSLLVLTFVMSVGLLFKVTQYIARGMSVGIVLDFIWGGIPGTLSYSIPIAALVAALLVFGRLSSDSEISAMRSSGISLAKIMRTPALIGLLLSVFCLHLNNNVSPDSAYARSSTRRKLRASDLTALIEPGKFVKVGQRGVYVGKRNGDTLTDLRITETTKDGEMRELRAREAILFTTNEVASLDMRDVTWEHMPGELPGTGEADRIIYNIGDFGNDGEARDAARPRRVKDKYTWMLLRDLTIAKGYPPETEKVRKTLSQSRVEIHSRISLALACVCFVIVGIPLGIQNQRRESSVGLAFSLAIAGAYYLFGITAESLAKHPAFYPHLIVWVPVAICLVTSAIFTTKNN